MIAVGTPLPDVVLGTARRFGYPRVLVTLPGRRYPLPVAPSPADWERMVALFRAQPGALQVMFAALIAWECDLRASFSPGKEGRA